MLSNWNSLNLTSFELKSFAFEFPISLINILYKSSLSTSFRMNSVKKIEGLLLKIDKLQIILTNFCWST